METDDDLWRTDDMSLAAFLAVNDLEIIKTQWHQTSCFWAFEDSDELADLVADYVGDQALVNPKHHSAMVGKLKRDMFARKGDQ